jgi:hypothetical protein
LVSNSRTDFAGDIRIGTNNIQSGGGTTAISLSGADVTLPTGNLNVNSGSTLLTSDFDNNSPLNVNATLLDTNYQAGGTINFQTLYKPSSGSATYTIPQNNYSIGKFAFQGSANTAGTTDVLAGQMLCQATETWSATANGTRYLFTANRDGEVWTTGSAVVLALKPENVSVQSDFFQVSNVTGTSRLEINSTKAEFKLPVQFPSNTAANWNAITGAVGMQVCVTNSAGGSHPNGMMAFWDTSNARWSYIHDNSAV